MKNRELLRAACALLGEPVPLAGDEEYEERASYILAAFCSEASPANGAWLRSQGQAEGEPYEGIFLGLDADFPLSARFAPAAVEYLAAVLLLEDDADGAERIFTRYCDRMTYLNAELSGRVEPIRQAYGRP